MDNQLLALELYPLSPVRYLLPIAPFIFPTGGGVMLRARVMTCVEGVDLALLQKAISEQRHFFQESEGDTGS